MPIFPITLGVLVCVVGMTLELRKRNRRKPKLEEQAPIWGLVLTVGLNEQNKNMNTLTIKDNQKVLLSLQFVDTRGNPTNPPSTPVWSSSDATILSVEPAPDGLSCWAVAAGKLGNAQITAATVIGGNTLTAVGSLQVLAGDAVQEILSAGAPVTQDPSPAPAAAATTSDPAPAPLPTTAAPADTVASSTDAPSPSPMPSTGEPTKDSAPATA